MSAIFDRLSPAWQIRFAAFGFLCASFMLAAAIAKLFLPESSIEKAFSAPFNFVRSYPLERALGIGDSITPQSLTNAPSQGSAASLSGLKLKALYAEGDKTGFVVIDDGKSLTFVSVGENLRGYTLTAVESKKAIFAKDGANYELRLDEQTREARVAANPRVSAGAIDAPQRKRVVERGELERYRQDPRKIWDSIGIAPITENGKFKEFRVTFVARDSVFSELGLQAGDVIKNANGVELDGYAAALRLYAEIDKMDSFRMTIVRNNQLKELAYEIR
jgi:type II secretion system protein C